MPLAKRDDLPAQLLNIWNHIGRADWLNPSHEWSKAYICSLFSWLAYGVIPKEEIQQVGHATIVPCELYQRFLLEGRSFTAQDLATPLDLGEAFQIIGTRILIIAVNVRAMNIIFVAVRGTKDFYDFMIDVDARKRKGIGGIKWHRGFFDLAAEHLPDLTAKIKGIRKNDELVYLTGHSLGGAVAGILNAIWNDPIPHSAYTFGMPRFANRVAKDKIRWPFHHYHIGDIVPCVPPKWMRYVDCDQAFRSDDNPSVNALVDDNVAYAFWYWCRLTARLPRNHYIENYRRDVGLKYGFDDGTWP